MSERWDVARREQDVLVIHRLAVYNSPTNDLDLDGLDDRLAGYLYFGYNICNCKHMNTCTARNQQRR